WNQLHLPRHGPNCAGGRQLQIRSERTVGPNSVLTRAGGAARWVAWWRGGSPSGEVGRLEVSSRGCPARLRGFSQIAKVLLAFLAAHIQPRINRALPSIHALLLRRTVDSA